MTRLTGNPATDSRLRFAKALRYAGRTILYATTIFLGDIIGLLALGPFTKASLILILLLEGGGGLLVGVAISLSSAPFITKTGEVLFGTSSWSREGERHAERVGFRWMLGSVVLILIGFALSAL